MSPDASPTRGATRYRRVRFVFRKATRIKVFEPTDRVHEKGILGAMARHGWRLVRVSDVSGDEGIRNPGEPRA